MNHRAIEDTERSRQSFAEVRSLVEGGTEENGKGTTDDTDHTERKNLEGSLRSPVHGAFRAASRPGIDAELVKAERGLQPRSRGLPMFWL